RGSHIDNADRCSGGKGIHCLVSVLRDVHHARQRHQGRGERPSAPGGADGIPPGLWAQEVQISVFGRVQRSWKADDGIIQCVVLESSSTFSTWGWPGCCSV